MSQASNTQAAIPVPAGVRIELQPTRGINDTTFRIAKVQDYTSTSMKLRAGMFLMAAIQGRTRVSFFKMAEPLVRKELDRLEQSGSEYLLLVSETPSAYITIPHPPPPPPPLPQAFSSPVSRNGVQTAAKQQQVSPNEDSEEYDNDDDEEDLGSLSSDFIRQNPEDAFLASVERLRAQRRAVEQIKRESTQKSSRIAQLEYEIETRIEQMEQLEQENEELKRAAWHISAKDEALEQEQKRAFQLEIELNALRAQTKQREEANSAQWEQERKQMHAEQARLQKSVDEAQLVNKELVLRVEEANNAKHQAELERDAGEKREEAARRAFERLAAEQREREVKLEHSVERTRQERDRITKRAEEIDLVLQNTRATCTNLREQVDSAREREFATAVRVQELEQQVQHLANEMEEAKTVNINRARQQEQEVDTLKHEISALQLALRKSKEETSAVQIKVDEEVKQHRNTKELLVKAESAKREAVESMERAQRHAKASTERLAEAVKAKDALHDRLVRALEKGNALADEVEQERLAGKQLAESRLELLAQFVEEERRLDGALANAVPLPKKRTSNSVRSRLEFASPASKTSQASVSYTPMSAYSYTSRMSSSSAAAHPSTSSSSRYKSNNHLV